MSSMNLHCIGDSHTAFFTGYNVIQPEYPQSFTSIVKNIYTYRLGSSLAYNLCESNSRTKSRQKLFEIIDTLNYKTDILLLSFGEVDCRAHVIKQAELKNITIEDAVKECILRYMLIIKELKDLKFKIVVWNAVPTAMGFENVKFEYPYYGTYEQRNKACILFNEELQKKSTKNDFIFISVYKLIISKNLKTNEKFYFDKIHLGNRLLPYTLKIIKDKIPQFKTQKIEILKIQIRILFNYIKMEKKTDRFINSVKKIFTKY